MTGFKIDYEVIDPSVTEQTIIEARFSHLFDVEVLGRFWSQLIDQIEGSNNFEVQTRMKSWLQLMIVNRTLVEPFDSIPVPVPKGSLPILARYNYTVGEIKNAIAVKSGVGLDETLKYKSPSGNQTIPKAASTAIKQQRLGKTPVVTEETTITQSLTYDTADGTVTEVRIVEVDKPPQASVSKKPHPFAPSSNWMMDEPPSPPPVTPARRGQRQPQETPIQPPPDQTTMAPRKKIDPFAPSSNWMMDDPPSPPPKTQQSRTRAEPPQKMTPMQETSEQPPMAPRKKIDPFAPSVAWYGDDSPKKAAGPREDSQRPRSRQQEAIVEKVYEQQAPVRTQKRNDFASSLAFGDPESPKKPTERRQERQTQPAVQQVQQSPPKSKRNDFASSIAFGGPESPEKSSSRYVKPTQQMATVQELQSKSPPRPKRNDFATSITFGSPEKPSVTTVADKTTIKQSHTVETSQGITSETKTITTTKTKSSPSMDPQVGFNTQRGSAYRSNFQLGDDDDVPDVQQRIRDTIIDSPPAMSRPQPTESSHLTRRNDAYKSSIGFGSQQDSPPRRRRERPGTEPVAQAPSVKDQGAAQVYQSRKGDAYKSSISFF